MDIQYYCLISKKKRIMDIHKWDYEILISKNSEYSKTVPHRNDRLSFARVDVRWSVGYGKKCHIFEIQPQSLCANEKPLPIVMEFAFYL